MRGAEELAKRLYEACLIGSVATLDALIEEDKLVLNRVNSTDYFFNETPLHVAVLCGHLDFTKALLIRQPKLATELDSQKCSPLHVASTEGHLEIVRELLRVNKDVCIAPDQDGRIPLHLAVMKGRVEVMKELLGAKPDSVHFKLGRGETVLHLAVKYNRLESLKILVEHLQNKGMESLLVSGDDDGNTILHLAADLKQVDTIKYLLGIKSVQDHANDKNQRGFSASDIVEDCPKRATKTMEVRKLLLQGGVDGSNHKSHHDYCPCQDCCKNGVLMTLMGCISDFWKKYIKVDPIWLKEVRGHLITAATLTATMAYQSILSPPGSFWQEELKNNVSSTAPVSSPVPYSSPAELVEGHKAGQAIMDTNGDDFAAYLYLNTIILGASLSTIMLAMTGFPMANKFLTWLLVFTVYITITCMAVAYVIAANLVSPDSFQVDAAYGLLLGWTGLCIFVLMLHSCRFLVWLVTKLVNCVKKCYKCCKPTPAPNNNSSEHNRTSSHKCVGDFC